LKLRSAEERRNSAASSSLGTNVRRTPVIGTRSATGRPATVIRMRSPASTSRRTLPMWLLEFALRDDLHDPRSTFALRANLLDRQGRGKARRWPKLLVTRTAVYPAW
jgi:hypothetical protein